jgi:hypothetical protein
MPSGIAALFPTVTDKFAEIDKQFELESGKKIKSNTEREVKRRPGRPSFASLAYKHSNPNTIEIDVNSSSNNNTNPNNNNMNSVCLPVGCNMIKIQR